ncbi:MAG: hypothetical protein EPN43_11250 [Jatrophihabitans sp.]|nr:MAG: hypothetical protein EPN43_11250 [Jatrophihabitans sp.]
MIRRRRPGRAAAAAVTLVVAATGTACSSSAGPSPAPADGTASSADGVQQITVHAKDFSFSPSTVTVHPGKVRLILVNDGGGAPHDWQVTDFPADFVPLTANGETKEASFTAPSPGRYQFVCTIHTKQGMVGSLVVLAR